MEDSPRGQRQATLGHPVDETIGVCVQALLVDKVSSSEVNVKGHLLLIFSRSRAVTGCLGFKDFGSCLNGKKGESVKGSTQIFLRQPGSNKKNGSLHICYSRTTVVTS